MIPKFLTNLFSRRNPRGRMLDYKRSLPDRQVWYRRWFRSPGATGSLILAFLLFLGTAIMDLWPIQPFLWREGQYVAGDVKARVNFWVPDPRKMEEKERERTQKVPLVFQLNIEKRDDLANQLRKVPALLKAAGTVDAVSVELRTQLGIKMQQVPQPMPESAPQSAPASAPAKVQYTSPVFDAWVALADDSKKKTFEQQITVLRAELANLLTVDPQDTGFDRTRPLRDIVLLEGRHPIPVEKPTVGQLIDLDKPEQIKTKISGITEEKFDAAILPSIRDFLTAELVSQPMYSFNQERTSLDIQSEISKLRALPKPPGARDYLTGQLLVSRTDSRSNEGLTIEQLQLLRKEHETYMVTRWKNEPWKMVQGALSRLVLIFIMILVISCYTGVFHRDMVLHNLQGLRLTILLLFMLAVTKITTGLLGRNPHFALLGLCIGGLILGIKHDQRFAVAVGSVMCLLTVFQVRGDFGMFMVFLTGTLTCICTVGEVRTRSRIIILSFIAGLLVLLVTWLSAIQSGIPWSFAIVDGLCGGCSVLLAGLIVQGLMPVVEYLFAVATGSTLLEWCDASKPLLKRLAMQSPGTYNHSLQVGAICEAAAESIGANGLLARVGAYYHDIGKIDKPEYFTENQDPGESKHTNLSPTMSNLVIIGHVKSGQELARQGSLPAQLREFISSHHGTTLVKYFYHMAVDQAHASNEAPPEEDRFRYPGPKPQSKEAAILMLADGAESSVRSMDKLTPTSIRQQVHAIVTDRLEDGQLEECDMTFREVHSVEQSIVKSLCGMYHGRIAYPSDEQIRRKKEEAQNGDMTEEHVRQQDEQENLDGNDSVSE